MFAVKARDVSSDAEVLAVLESLKLLLPSRPSELTDQCRMHATLADLRDALGLDFVRFNEALVRPQPPRAPLRHLDRHEKALARFVEDHEEAILDRLREAFLPRATGRARPHALR